MNTQPAPSTPPPAQAAFSVNSAIIGAMPSPDHCTETLYTDITTNGAGTVTYQW